MAATFVGGVSAIMEREIMDPIWATHDSVACVYAIHLGRSRAFSGFEIFIIFSTYLLPIMMTGYLFYLSRNVLTGKALFYEQKIARVSNVSYVSTSGLSDDVVSFMSEAVCPNAPPSTPRITRQVFS